MILYTPMVLVDSSVWISYFRHGSHRILEQLLMENLVCTNDLILTELMPSLRKNKMKQIMEGLEVLPKIRIDIDWEIIQEYQYLNLINGLNKVGIPDLVIMQQVIQHKATLYSEDKHFKIMQEIFDFQLIRSDDGLG